MINTGMIKKWFTLFLLYYVSIYTHLQPHFSRSLVYPQAIRINLEVDDPQAEI